MTRSDDGGLTWPASNIVLIPPDGNASTDYPFDLAVESQGRGAVGYGQNGSSGDSICGNPKLSGSYDFVHRKTCAAGPIDLTGRYQPYPVAIQSAFGGNDKLYMLWTDSNEGIVLS